MCLDYGHFQLALKDEEQPLENVASVLVGDGKLTLIDVFGKKREISGRIAEIDLLNRRIVLS